MAFLDDVEELEEKLKGRGISLPVVAVVLVVVLALVFFGLKACVSYLSSDDVSFRVAQEAAEEADDGGEEAGEESANSPQLICVYVTGAVQNPGVYEVSSDARVNDALQLAGGATKKANLEGVNLAATLQDGQQITIPRKGEEGASGSGAASSGNITSGTSSGASSGGSAGLVNVNTATSEELQTLPGIGPALAQRIIDYRTSQGSFKSCEDITNVSGIGEKTYERISSLICI